MATATRICRVCGKEYKYCRTLREDAGVFRWQDIACCKEHGKQYFDQILASRAEAEAKLSDSKIQDDGIESRDILNSTPVIHDYVEDEDDENTEFDFDDDEDEIIVETN